MSDRRRYNFVTFKLDDAPDDGSAELELRLDADWVITAGLKPDANSAIVSYEEFDKLKNGSTETAGTAGDETETVDTLSYDGEIRFYFSSPDVPDHTLTSIRIIDIEAAAMGTVLVDDPDDPDAPQITQARVVEYRLWFHDRRRLFQYPRGGRLFYGEVNKTNQVDDKDDTSTLVQYTNSILISLCLAAMGEGVDAPDNVNFVQPITNLTWLGALPAEELQKILDHVGHVYCPSAKPNSNPKIVEIGSGDEPTIPEGQELPALQLPGLDRRGKTAVYTSAPTAVYEEWNSDAGSGKPVWQFVARDKNGKFVTFDKLDDLGGKSPADLIKTKFASITNPSRKAQLQQDLYHFLRLDPDKFPPSLCPIFTKHATDPGTRPKRPDIYVSAKIATLDAAQGVWNNSSTSVLQVALSKTSQNVIYVQDRIQRVAADGSNDPDADFVAASLDSVDFRVEAWDSQLKMKEYFYCGFTVDEGGTLTQLEDDAAKAIALSGGGDDAVVFSMPEMQYSRLNGVPNAEAKSLAIALCRRHAIQNLKGSGTTYKVRTAVGFIPADLNGKISEIRYSQQAVTTTFKINAWHMPSAALRRDELERMKSGAFPGQHQSQPTRSFLGASGAVQSSNMLFPPAAKAVTPANSIDNALLFNLKLRGGGYGDNATFPSLTYDLYPIDVDPASAGATPLATNLPLTGMGQRIAKATILMPATQGIGKKNKDGTYKLVYANEVYAQKNCPPTT